MTRTATLMWAIAEDDGSRGMPIAAAKVIRDVDPDTGSEGWRVTEEMNGCSVVSFFADAVLADVPLRGVITVVEDQ